MRRRLQEAETPTNSDVYVEPTLDVIPATTATAATNLINSTAHGLVEGDLVIFTALTGGNGLATDTPYFVIADGLTANAFKVSATRRGTEIDITSDATAATAVAAKCLVNSVSLTEVDRDPDSADSVAVLIN